MSSKLEGKSWKTVFYEKAILGQKSDFSNPDDVISRCIFLAYKDMLTAGRFYLSSRNSENETRRINFKKELEKCNYEFSRDLIMSTSLLFGDVEIIGKENKYATRYGLSQKLVNMSYKYFWLYFDYINKEIDFSKCDCPLDSIVLGHDDLKIISQDIKWSKISSEDYFLCQDEITKLLGKAFLDQELLQLGNLAFDFFVW